jgi:predicted O-methyltransferase YrrM
MLENHKTFDLDGRERVITGGISRIEAESIRSLIAKRRVRNSMETGVAYGVSTVAICDALSRLGGERKHWGVDPCQYTDHNGAAIAALRKCGCEHLFELLEGPSHLMLSRLLERGVELDLALIDGWHTFDYTLLDVFYSDKLLKPGGILMMHDLDMPSKVKVWRFLRTHRHYRRLPGPARSRSRCVLSAGKAALLFRPWIFRHGFLEFFRLTSRLLVAEKLDDWEPNFDYFRNF